MWDGKRGVGICQEAGILVESCRPECSPQDRYKRKAATQRQKRKHARFSRSVFQRQVQEKARFGEDGRGVPFPFGKGRLR